MESSDLKEYLEKVGVVIPLDKPLGWTSFDATNKVRIHLKYKQGIPKIKAGHAGTLDPLATGLLLICVGKTTRTISTLQDMPKTYTGTFLLGATTPSFDAETEISEEMPTEHITPEMIHEAARSLTGLIMQEPPLFSAIKVDGKRAYRMARKNEDVTLESRQVHIHAFNVTAIEGREVHFEIRCSKGTYIRSVARDFGRLLKSCAYLTSLRRTAIGDYHVSSALTIDRIAEAFGPGLPLLPE